ncbi:MAG: protein translocase subunit SecD [Clostridia bacterium]|nr:protein translocase subunit SecD [Clostridia bacterium]
MQWRNIVALLVITIIIGVSSYFSISPIERNINFGLDLQGGLSVTLEGRPTKTNQVTAESVENAMNVLRTRVDALGVKESIIQRQGKNRILVQIAGVKDPEEAVRLIGKTASLEFRSPDGQVLLTGADLVDARGELNPLNNQSPQVALAFNSEGTKKFAEATRKYKDQTIGIYLDNKLLTNPKVNSVITNGQAVIEGGYTTLEEAVTEAALLKGGALPINLEMMEKRVVGPTLGADSLAMSKEAGVAGLVAILVFMVAYYRLPGLLANVALVVYSILVLGIMAIFGATLTLPGIAGFLLSIGMAVDTNIIIFERFKEELRTGKTLRAAIDAGFNRAFATVLDANLTTIIAGIVLYYLFTGTIKGFAVTLIIGILANMFTAIVLTKWLLKLMAGARLKNFKLYG